MRFYIDFISSGVQSKFLCDGLNLTSLISHSDSTSSRAVPVHVPGCGTLMICIVCSFVLSFVLVLRARTLTQQAFCLPHVSLSIWSDVYLCLDVFSHFFRSVLSIAHADPCLSCLSSFSARIKGCQRSRSEDIYIYRSLIYFGDVEAKHISRHYGDKVKDR